MNVPTKTQLKEKYDISNDDFEVLTEFPSESIVRQKGFLIKVAEAFGAQEWMFKNWQGYILAIIFILPNLHGTIDFWRLEAVYGFQHLQGYCQQLQFPLPKDNHEWIAFTPDADLPPLGAQVPLPSGLPIGSGIYPASGQAPFV